MINSELQSRQQREASPYAKSRRTRRRACSGFTLLEALLSLIMFGIIMSALSLVFSTALRVQRSTEQVQDDNGTVRSLMDFMKRDIQAAYGSVEDPSSVFIAGGAASTSGQNNVTSPGLLTLTSYTNRIQADDLFSAGGSNTSNSSSGTNVDPPQSTTAIVRYDLDQTSGELSRTIISVPNPTLVAAPNPGDNSAILAKHVRSVTFQFWDAQQQQWRTTWDYEQQNQPQAPQTQTSTTGTTATTGSTSSTTGSSSSTTTALNNTDTYLPSAVQVSIVYTNSRGTDQTLTTIIPVVSSQPYIDPNTQTTSSSTTIVGAGNSGTGKTGSAGGTSGAGAGMGSKR